MSNGPLRLWALMTRIRSWLLPAVLVAAQLVMWPGMALTDDTPLDRGAAAAAVAAIVLAGVCLCWRRRAPVAVAVAVAALLSVAFWAGSYDHLTLISVADLIALYSVAVHRSTRTVLLMGAGLVGWQAVGLLVWQQADVDGLGDEYAFMIGMAVAGYLITIGLGRGRRRWHADRAGAAHRLAEAEARRRQAADTERHRLARELHDVTAHHLTSIVVTASAAQRLAGRRPELAAEALDFTARTGRQTLDALHRLVAVMQTAEERPTSPAEQLEQLASGFRRLGQVISVDAEPERMPSPVAEAVHGIVRESLTNTLRYAPGSAVRVRLTSRAGSVELIVDDDGSAPQASAVPALGSGRGLTGMRERAAAVGGTCAAGRRDGGWRVRAVLPTVATGHRITRATRWRPRPGQGMDVAVAVAAWLPLGASTFLPAEDGGMPAPSVALALLLSGVLTAPLLWRRQRPWVALGVVLLGVCGWPAAIALGAAPVESAFVTFFTIFHCFAAAYAVGAFGGRPAVTWVCMLPTAGVWGALTGLVLVADGLEDPVADTLPLIIFSQIVGGVVAMPVALAWGAGALVHRRRTRLRAREDGTVAWATAWALAEAHAERHRVATGLQQAVLHRTGAVVAAAERGDLDAVLQAARSALTAMRGLLTDLRESPQTRRDPQPGAAGLGALCTSLGSAGRTVGLRLTGTARALPADVDISVFRIVELALGTGGADAPEHLADAAGHPTDAAGHSAGTTGHSADTTGHLPDATVHLDYGDTQLRLILTGVPPDPQGALAAGLRARVTAAGGTIAPTPAGTIDVRLPAPATAPEVTPSPST